MTTIDKDFVLTQFADIYANREEFLADVREAPETRRERIWQIQELRDLAVKVGLEADYLALMDELLHELTIINEKFYSDEYYAEE